MIFLGSQADYRLIGRVAQSFDVVATVNTGAIGLLATNLFVPAARRLPQGVSAIRIAHFSMSVNEVAGPTGLLHALGLAATLLCQGTVSPSPPFAVWCATPSPFGLGRVGLDVSDEIFFSSDLANLAGSNLLSWQIQVSAEVQNTDIALPHDAEIFGTLIFEEWQANYFQAHLGYP